MTYVCTPLCLLSLPDLSDFSCFFKRELKLLALLHLSTSLKSLAARASTSKYIFKILLFLFSDLSNWNNSILLEQKSFKI